MSKLTEHLNQITEWIQHHNPKEWDKIKLDSGLSIDQIQSHLEGKSFVLPQEIIELYKWRNGTGYGSFFISTESGYDQQEFYDLGFGLGQGEEWQQDYCPGTSLLALFSFEGTYYWTILPDIPQEFAPIYASDGPDFDTTSPSYPSLTAMVEEMIALCKFVWKIE
jgi:hypothetical protein